MEKSILFVREDICSNLLPDVNADTAVEDSLICFKKMFFSDLCDFNVTLSKNHMQYIHS